MKLSPLSGLVCLSVAISSTIFLPPAFAGNCVSCRNSAKAALSEAADLANDILDKLDVFGSYRVAAKGRLAGLEFAESQLPPFMRASLAEARAVMQKVAEKILSDEAMQEIKEEIIHKFQKDFSLQELREIESSLNQDMGEKFTKCSELIVDMSYQFATEREKGKLRELVSDIRKKYKNEITLAEKILSETPELIEPLVRSWTSPQIKALGISKVVNKFALPVFLLHFTEKEIRELSSYAKKLKSITLGVKLKVIIRESIDFRVEEVKKSLQ